MSGKPIRNIPEEQIDQIIAKTLYEASLEVLKITAGVEATFDGEYSDDPLQGTSAFKGVVGLSGVWNGTLFFWIPFNLARRLTARIAGCDPETLNEAYIKDGAAEIINQIAGRMMTILSQKGHKVRPDIPVTKLINHLEPETHSSITTLSIKCADSRIVLHLSPDTPPPEPD